MKQKTFGRSRPSIAYELQYRKVLNKLIQEMQKDVENELKRYCDNEIVADAAAVKWIQIMKALRLKWYREFDVKARELAKWFADKTNKRTMAQIQRKLKEVGMAITPSYTAAQKQLISEIVAENVGMIESIPRQYLREIQKVTTGAFKRGGDRAMLTKYLEKVLKRVDDDTRHKAVLIARDQTNKATQQLAIANAQALGIKFAYWIHVPGKYSSRKTHIEMNGKKFNIDYGIHDSDVGREVKPGELPYCNCQMSFIVPGFE